jgi:RNA polymerase sigma-70 factor (ECF subfamily)
MPQPDAEFDRRAVQSLRSAGSDAQRRQAWRGVLEVYEPLLRGLATRITRSEELGRDVVQEAIIRAITKFHTFDDRARLGTWLFRVTYNAAITRLRQERRRAMPSLDAPTRNGAFGDHEFTSARTEPGPADGVQEREDRGDLLQALDMMDDEQRGLLLLRDGQGLDYGTIAEVLGVPRGTIKSRLFRARVTLRASVQALRQSRLQ